MPCLRGFFRLTKIVCVKYHDRAKLSAILDVDDLTWMVPVVEMTVGKEVYGFPSGGITIAIIPTIRKEVHTSGKKTLSTSDRR